MRSANYQKFLREVNAVPDAEPTLNRADAEPTLNRAGRASREIARKWFTGEALTLNRTLYPRSTRLTLNYFPPLGGSTASRFGVDSFSEAEQEIRLPNFDKRTPAPLELAGGL